MIAALSIASGLAIFAIIYAVAARRIKDRFESTAMYVGALIFAIEAVAIFVVVIDGALK